MVFCNNFYQRKRLGHFFSTGKPRAKTRVAVSALRACVPGHSLRQSPSTQVLRSCHTHPRESGWVIFLARGNPVRKLGWPCQHSAPMFQGTAYGRAPPRRRYAAATSTLVKAVGSFFVFASSPGCVPYPLISYRVPPISPPPCCVPMADTAPPLCR